MRNTPDHRWSLNNGHTLQSAFIFLPVIDDVTNPDFLHLIRKSLLYLAINLRVFLAGVSYQNKLPRWESLHDFTNLHHFLLKSGVLICDQFLKVFPGIWAQEILPDVLHVEGTFGKTPFFAEEKLRKRSV